MSLLPSPGYTSIYIESLRVLHPIPNVHVYNSNDEIPEIEDVIWRRTESASFVDRSSFWGELSKVPVVVDPDEVELIQARVSIGDKSLAGKECKLAGSIYDITLSSELHVIRTTEMNFSVHLEHEQSFKRKLAPWGVAGNVEWSLNCRESFKNGMKRRIKIDGATSVEVYGIATELPRFFNNVVSVKLLRSFVLSWSREISSRTANHQEYIPWAIDASMSDFGFKYDTQAGGSSFNLQRAGGNFNLAKWFRQTDTGSRCNCYDQAALVQTALGISPIGNTTWHYMQPFVYIRPTKLLGVGKCNNPFYEDHHYSSAKITYWSEKRRSKFGNHAFVQVMGRDQNVADATAGPHLADEDLKTYIADSIDSDRTLYSPGDRPGTMGDVTKCDGVLNVILPGQIIPSTEKPRYYPAGAINEGTGHMGAIKARGINSNMVNINISEIREIFHSDYDHTISEDHSELQWLLPYGFGEDTTATISIHHSSMAAVDAMKSHLEGYQRPLEEIFGASSSQFPGMTNELSSESYGSLYPFRTRLWIQGNIFTRVSGSLTLRYLDSSIITPLKHHYAQHTAEIQPETTLKVPNVRNVIAPSQAEKGKLFTVRAEVDDCGVSVVSTGRNDKILLQKADQEKKEYRFKAVGLGTQEIVFAFAHKTSGGVVSTTITVIVVAPQST